MAVNNDEINEKSINLAVRVSKLTADEIKKALEKLINVLSSPDKKPEPELKPGKQTLKQLSKHNDGLSSMELTDPNLRLLYREMKKHHIDFAAVKDGKGKNTLFFKGKNADVMTRAFNQYTQKVIRHENKPSIKKSLAAAKKLAQSLNNQLDRVKNRSKGELSR